MNKYKSTVTEDYRKYKAQAAQAAVDQFVRSHMVVGLGTGSTAYFAVEYLAQQLSTGTLHDIIGIPTSQRTADHAARLNIPLMTLDDHPRIDVTLDGADEIAPGLDLIKGGGGALLREKIVAQASAVNVAIADSTKFVPQLGTTWPVPVEVVPFGLAVCQHFLESLGGVPAMRQTTDDEPYQTDQGNYIWDTQFGPLADPAGLALRLDGHAAIMAHGLFLGLAHHAIIAGVDGLQHVSRA